jgi:amidohydrolase
MFYRPPAINQKAISPNASSTANANPASVAILSGRRQRAAGPNWEATNAAITNKINAVIRRCRSNPFIAGMLPLHGAGPDSDKLPDPCIIARIWLGAGMRSKDELKRAVCEAIDRHGNEIIALGEEILHHPETGFNERKTAALVAERMRQLELQPETGLALTGVKGRIRGKAPGPRLALIGELDSLRTSDHPLADAHTGAAHTCGHNAQIAGMLGVAVGLSAIGAAADLAGELVFFAVPAEEFIDVEERLGRKEAGEIEFLLGKPELLAKGHFDDIDMAMMIHAGSHDQMSKRSYIADSSNGALVKMIRFMGRASHAGGAPQLGINALSAAMLALSAIHAQRESFWDKDTVRIHPIITKGGDAVSVVPAEVTMETFVRAGSREAIIDANIKVDRCLRAGAMAMGAEVEINTIPGYLPQRNDRRLGETFGHNVETLFGAGSFDIGGHRTGSTDMGDIAHLIPVIHPYVASARGKTHGADFRITEPEHAYLTPAKLLAMTAIDLLYDDAAPAREILGDFRPAMTKAEYLTFARGLFKTERWKAEV